MGTSNALSFAQRELSPVYPEVHNLVVSDQYGVVECLRHLVVLASLAQASKLTEFDAGSDFHANSVRFDCGRKFVSAVLSQAVDSYSALVVPLVLDKLPVHIVRSLAG